MESKLAKAENEIPQDSNKESDERMEMDIDSSSQKADLPIEIFSGFDLTANTEYAALCEQVGNATTK